jgi:hypothetical protein
VSLNNDIFKHSDAFSSVGDAGGMSDCDVRYADPSRSGPVSSVALLLLDDEDELLMVEYLLRYIFKLPIVTM